MAWNNNPVLTVSQMYAADSMTIDAGATGVDLMARAGEAVANAVRELSSAGKAKAHPNRKILVLCGPGNNGGDGFVAAKLLRDQGYDVKLFAMKAVEGMAGDALFHARQWCGDVSTDLLPQDFESADVIVDALFGAGLSRPLDGKLELFSRWAQSRPVVAVDVPSGVSGDTGQVVGESAFEATRTVTFFLKKPGHLLYPGRQKCGKVTVADIGIVENVLRQIAPHVAENDPDLWLDQIPQFCFDKHKYDFGHALVWGGAMSGAARLAAMAALRTGSGLVSVLCPEKDLSVYALTSPSLMLHPVDQVKGQEISRIGEVISNKKINALLIGPGGGREAALKSVVLRFLKERSKALVLDADAISVFEDCPSDLIKKIHDKVVLTPHEGEFKRLFPDLNQSKMEKASEAARQCGGVVVLKGADTVIAAPDGRIVINTNAPNSLAKGGTGDVLAGIITGLLAQGLAPFEAACAGVWVHGAAASQAGAGLIADDLLPEIRFVAARILKSEGQ